MTVPYPRALERFPVIRQSRLATFDRCALSAHFDEEYRYGWSGHPAARGSIFHRVAAEALRRMYDARENTIPADAVIEILDSALRQSDVDKACPSCGKPIVRRYMAEPTEDMAFRGVEVGYPRVVCANGHDHSSDFVNLPMSEIADLRWVCVKWASQNAFDIENLVDVEQRIKATLRYPAGDGTYVERELSGALDAIFVTGDALDEAVVLDWKDSWAMPGPSEVGFDGYFQQRFYAWLVFKNYPMIRKVTLREFYVRYSEAREAVVFRDDIDDIEAEFSALAERFDRAFHDGTYPPTPGHHCGFCPRPAACPIFPGVRAEGTIADPKTARRFAAEAQVAASALKQRTRALSAWASVHGPVEVSTHKGRRAWGHREITRTARPTQKQLAEAVAANGGRPLTQAQVQDMFVTKKGTRFELMELSAAEPVADDAALMAALEQSVTFSAADPSGAAEKMHSPDQGET